MRGFDSQIAKIGKTCGAVQGSSCQNGVPDLACLLPGVAAKADSCFVECLIWNAGIRMDAAEVAVWRIRGMFIVAHICRLGIDSKSFRIVICSPRRLQGSEGCPIDACLRDQQAVTDEPIGFV